MADAVGRLIQQHGTKSTPANSQSSSSSSQTFATNSQSSTTSSAPQAVYINQNQSSTHRQQRSSTPVFSTNATRQTLQSTSLKKVLLIANAGDYGLSQISVDGIGTRAFFQNLRMEYFSLRGLLRRYLSVWSYSHCDFYQVGTA